MVNVLTTMAKMKIVPGKPSLKKDNIAMGIVIAGIVISIAFIIEASVAGISPL